MHFGDVGRLGVDILFVATKFLLAIPRQQILEEERQKELSRRARQRKAQRLSEYEVRGNAGKQAITTARKRLQRARELAQVQHAYLIRGFAKEFGKKRVLAQYSSWVKAK